MNGRELFTVFSAVCATNVVWYSSVMPSQYISDASHGSIPTLILGIVGILFCIFRVVVFISEHWSD